MNKFRFLSKIFLLIIFVSIFAFSANAQKRRTTRKPAAKTMTSTNTPTTGALVKEGAAKVAVQIKNLTKFIYNLGAVARAIEDLDKEIAAGRGSSNARSLNAKNKAAVLTTIENLRAGLVALEVEFRAKPELRQYNSNLLGIADLSAQTEDLAAAGRITDSGNVLLEIVEKLTDTLAAMP